MSYVISSLVCFEIGLFGHFLSCGLKEEKKNNPKVDPPFPVVFRNLNASFEDLIQDQACKTFL